MKRRLLWVMLLLVAFDGASCVAFRALLHPRPALTAGERAPVPTCQAVFDPGTTGACARRDVTVTSAATAQEWDM